MKTGKSVTIRGKLYILSTTYSSLEIDKMDETIFDGYNKKARFYTFKDHEIDNLIEDMGHER